MNTSSTNPTTAFSRWTHFSRMIRRSLGVSLSTGLTTALFLVIFMVGCKEEGPGILNVCIAPTVIRTSPANGVANVPLSKLSNATESAFAATVKRITTISKISGVTGSTTITTVKVISATFSTPMDPNSITASTFNVWQGNTPVLGAVLYSDTTAIFVVPNGLDPNLTYTCTITTGVKDLAGNALANNYVWIFTTGDAPDITLPTVSSTAPANAATGVPFNQKIAATFSTTMDASTITSTTFILKQGTTSVSGFVSYSGIVAIFAPASPLAPNTGYTATITTKAKDLAGNALAKNFIWNFTTGAAAVVTPPTVSFTDPVDAATGVPLNQKIAATFSKTMDASTFTSATFTLKQGTTVIPGYVSYSGTTAIFAPTSNLAPNTVYTATITTAAKDLAGNALAKDFVWSFTAGAAVVVTPPTVSFTDPLNVATGVVLNQKIAATFSKTMDATTIQTSTFFLRQGITPVSGFVSYSGTTAIFAPASNLAPNTVYTATITTAAKDLAGNALANNFVWSFTTGSAVVVTPPTVSFTDPVNAATGVALNQKIAATFSTTMDASTIHTSTFTLKQGTTSVSGFVSYSGTTAIFAPASNLASSTVYTATITTEAKDLAGNALANNFVWSFTTGAAVVITPPVVIATDPDNAAPSVALNQKIAAAFSKTMNASTITTSTFTLKQGTTPIQGFVSYSGITAIFTPTSNLAPSTLYTATITTGARDLAGNALANDYVWSFTTGAAVVVTPPTVISTDPANTATGVALNKHIAATFSKTMDASTFITPTFILRQGATSISGYVSYSGTTAIFTPISDLTQNTTYTATITTGAKDLAGNALANDYVWSFTTAATIAPTVIRTDPANAEICVALNKHVTATFSRRMNGSTITTAIFTLMETQGARFVSGVVSYVDSTATFTPLINLTPNTNYTATITTEAWDLAGNPMSSNYVWNFTTVVPYTVTLSSSPSAGGTTTGGGTFNSCSSITVTATPSTGYTFTNWTEGVNVVSTNASYTFTLNGNRTLVANFEINTYTLTVTPIPLAGGTVNKNPDQTTYNYGSNVILAAIPAVGYTFTSWSGDASGNINPLTVTMNANKNINANFTAIPQYNVTLSSNPTAGGSTGGGGTFYSGASITVTATPNIGYTFTSWKEGVNVVSTNANYTFTISADRTLVANFTAIPQYIVALSSNPVAGGSTGGSGTFTSGAFVTVTATPASGYTFTNWKEGVNVVSTNASYTFTISADRTLVANFTALPSGPAPVDLLSAGNFAILAGSGVSNTSVTTHIYGNVGSFPTATIVGLLAGNVTGTLYTTADPIVGTAKTDLTTAYNDAQGRSLNAISLPGQLGGLTLAPGLYVNSTSSGISGTGSNAILTLDAGGNANAVWIFKMGSTLITDAGTSIVLAGNASWKNVFWSVGTSATLGTNSIFYGNILADQAITLTTGATLYGRALTRIAAVTLDANIVDKR